jgi:signal transduction histidine kinase
VHDNGVGVPQEKIALLFSKYGQLASGLRKEGGTGLGLYISKGIVESHGGKIWLDSHEGEGTTVSFSFPFIAKIDQPAVESNTVPASKVIPQNALN